MSLPEFLEEHSLLHDSLLFRSVEAAPIDQAELQPSSKGIAVRLRGLIAGKEVG